jgi:CheY-like chemotaxis protein
VAERVPEERTPALAKTPLVIAVTGRGSEEDRRRSAEAGIDLHLTKPVDAGLLSRVLRRFQDIIR